MVAQGYSTMKFCNNLGHDEEGDFCIVKAIEGYGCHCSHSAEDCHVVDFFGRPKIQCGGEKLGVATLVGVCQDFEPAPWMLQELLGVNDFSI
jgi:hypothetical protein